MKKGKPPTTFLYQTLQSWGPNDKGFEMTPSEGKAMNFECDDSDAQALADGMTAKARALAKAQKEAAKKAAQEASTPKKDSPEEEEEQVAEQVSVEVEDKEVSEEPETPEESSGQLDAAQASTDSDTSDDEPLAEPEPEPEPEPELFDRGVCYDFADDGKIGVVWEAKSDCVAINHIKSGSLAAQRGGLEIGMVLQGLQISASAYQRIEGMRFKDVLELTRSKDRPLKMFFATNDDSTPKMVSTDQDEEAQQQALGEIGGAATEDDSATSSDDDDSDDSEQAVEPEPQPVAPVAAPVASAAPAAASTAPAAAPAATPATPAVDLAELAHKDEAIAKLRQQLEEQQKHTQEIDAKARAALQETDARLKLERADITRRAEEQKQVDIAAATRSVQQKAERERANLEQQMKATAEAAKAATEKAERELAEQRRKADEQAQAAAARLARQQQEEAQKQKQAMEKEARKAEHEKQQDAARLKEAKHKEKLAELRREKLEAELQKAEQKLLDAEEAARLREAELSVSLAAAEAARDDVPEDEEDESDGEEDGPEDDRDEEDEEPDEEVRRSDSAYWVVHRCAVRTSFDVESEQTEILQPGQLIYAFSKQENEFGQTRVEFSRGWVSVQQRDGAPLLVPTRLTAVVKAAVREFFDFKSAQVGVLRPGDKIEALDARANETGQIRIEFAFGDKTAWTSITARNGTVLLMESAVVADALGEPASSRRSPQPQLTDDSSVVSPRERELESECAEKEEELRAMEEACADKVAAALAEAKQIQAEARDRMLKMEADFRRQLQTATVQANDSSPAGSDQAIEIARDAKDAERKRIMEQQEQARKKAEADAAAAHQAQELAWEEARQKAEADAAAAQRAQELAKQKIEEAAALARAAEEEAAEKLRLSEEAARANEQLLQKAKLQAQRAAQAEATRLAAAEKARLEVEDQLRKERAQVAEAARLHREKVAKETQELQQRLEKEKEERAAAEAAAAAKQRTLQEDLQRMQSDRAQTRRELEATSTILQPIVAPTPQQTTTSQADDLDSMRQRLADMEKRAKERTQRREESRVSDMRARLSEMEARARQRSEIWGSVATASPNKPAPSPPQPHRPQQPQQPQQTRRRMVPDVEPFPARQRQSQPATAAPRPQRGGLGQYPTQPARKLERPPPPPNKAAFKAQQLQQQRSTTPKRREAAPLRSPALSQPSLSLSTASSAAGDTPVKATLTLKQNFKMVVDDDERSNFESGFMDELASFLGVDQSRVRILEVREGAG
jgi:hypothetical protein